MSGIDTPNGRPKPRDDRRDNQDLPSIQPVAQDSAERDTEDPISEIDGILEHWTDRQHQFAEREAQAQAEAKRFLEGFVELSEHVIKPGWNRSFNVSERTVAVDSSGRGRQRQRIGRGWFSGCRSKERSLGRLAKISTPISNSTPTWHTGGLTSGRVTCGKNRAQAGR